MRARDITDVEGFANWLEAQIQGISDQEGVTLCSLLAHRSVARILPPALVWSAAQDMKNHLSPLTLFRTTLVSGVAGSCPSSNIQAASLSAGVDIEDADIECSEAGIKEEPGYQLAAKVFFAAADAAYSASLRLPLSSFADACGSIFNCASVTDETSTMLEALVADCVAVERKEKLLEFPLWPGSFPFWEDWRTSIGILNHDSLNEAQMAREQVDWSFWICWYERLLEGKNPRYDRLAAILETLTPEEWYKGPFHVNPRLNEALEFYNLGERADETAQHV